MGETLLVVASNRTEESASMNWQMKTNRSKVVNCNRIIKVTTLLKKRNLRLQQVKYISFCQKVPKIKLKGLNLNQEDSIQ